MASLSCVWATLLNISMKQINTILLSSVFNFKKFASKINKPILIQQTPCICFKKLNLKFSRAQVKICNTCILGHRTKPNPITVLKAATAKGPCFSLLKYCLNVKLT